MDPAPLVKAHDHARTAALAHTDTTVAINEHALAAGEFSNAAKTTTSTEALRTLRLLEEHHRRLSELLKLPLEPRAPASAAESEHDDMREKAASAAGTDSQKAGSDGSTSLASTRRTSTKSATSAQNRRYPPSREISSIASNLASARGIRSTHRGQPLAPSVSIDQAPGSVDGAMRKDGTRSKMQTMLDKNKPSWVPPSAPAERLEKRETAQTQERGGAAAATTNDDGYSKFYSTFGNLIRGLSAPLAFAGLPLIAEEPAPEPPSAPEPTTTRKTRVSKSQHTPSEPDLTRIYSKATLQALGHKGHAPNDSFYFVPATGGTVSYANILSFDQKEKRRNAASIHGDGDFDDTLLEDVADDEDFVDAKESQASSINPGAKKRMGMSKTAKDLHNVVEELYLENKGLKEMLDKLSKRLHAFEANAQNSHLALQSSMRLMRPGSPLSASVGGSGGRRESGGGGDGLRRRNAELEEELSMALKRMATMEKDLTRLEKTNEMYRDRWEKLKAGARARRGAQGAAAEAGGSSSQTQPQ